ncbi:hypothetical protein [Candidatus Odyssella thessalonicensis]|uniref:hypothetical protein n=1 Tax=Candidatus Odyssella thessalonicensis TaxID=84647 RepID=UPI000225C217|nr:hypothetical protein [Candidatus Odyssella thessalonicensis]
MFKSKCLMVALLTTGIGCTMDQETKELISGTSAIAEEYHPWPHTYPGMSKDYPPHPLRVSAEFVDHKFPDHIKEMIIVDLARGQETIVGTLTPFSRRDGARWSINEDYRHGYEYVQLAYKVLTAGYSPLYPIPAKGGGTREIMTLTGETQVIQYNPFKIPTVYTTGHYLPNIRLSFQGNLASPYNLRASALVGKLTPMNIAPRSFSGRTVNKEGHVIEGCPENDPEIFKTLAVRATLVTDDYGNLKQLTPYQRDTIEEIARDMADYYIKAKSKYGVEIDLDKLGQSFSQRGHYRSNLIVPVVTKLKQVLANSGDHGVSSLLTGLNSHLNSSE